MSPQPNIFDQVNPSSTTTPPPVTLPVAGASASGNIFDQVNPAGATGAITAPPASTPPVGPNGQPNPRNVYAATDEESTPEGAAAAIARREGQHPILSGIGQGTESLLQPVFHPIDMVENIVKQSLPPFQVYDAVKKAYPLIQTYENARSSGKSVWQSISAANDYAKKQDEASQAVEKAIADYKKNPTQTTAKILTEVAGNVALLAAGGSGATAEADVPLVTRAAETEAPVAETEAETSAAAPKPGIIKQIWQGKKVAQPGTQGAVREAAQTSVKAANEATVAREAAQSKVQVPDEYKDLVNEAMNQEPAWTPEKAQPVVKALGDNFEVRGSVGEGKVTNNDLDIYQKTGKLSDASAKLTDLGFKRAYETDHGEVWTNEKTGQNVDLWDAQHEPKPGFGPDQTPESEPELPIANKKSPAVSANAPLVKGNTTILDDHLDTLEANEKATYKRMDETAGFDVKA